MNYFIKNIMRFYCCANSHCSIKLFSSLLILVLYVIVSMLEDLIDIVIQMCLMLLSVTTIKINLPYVKHCSPFKCFLKQDHNFIFVIFLYQYYVSYNIEHDQSQYNALIMWSKYKWIIFSNMKYNNNSIVYELLTFST